MFQARAAATNPLQISDALWEEIRARFSEEEIVELTLLVGLTAMLNRFNGDYDT